MTILINIEDAIVSRLTQGLGRMAREVNHYRGELESISKPAVTDRFPIVWVGFAGATKTEAYGTSRQQYKTRGEFSVIVADQDAFPGEITAVGTYPLIYGVRRLLSQQDLGLAIEPLRPGIIRLLRDMRCDGQAFSAYVCRFQTAWIETALNNQHWPSPESADEPDSILADHDGRLESPAPYWLRTKLDYHLTPDNGKADAEDIVNKE